MNVFKFLPLVGVAIFILLVARLDIPAMASMLLYVNFTFLALAILVTFLIVAMKAYRWKVLIRPFGYECPFPQAMKYWLSGFFIGIITPGRIGDLSRALYLKKELGFGKSLNTVVVDRVIDIALLLLFAIAGAFILTAAYSESQAVPATLAFLVLFSGALLVVSKKNYMKALARPLFRRIVPDQHKDGARVTFHDFYDGLFLVRKSKGKLAVAFALSAISILMLALQYYLITVALGITVPYTFLLLIVPLISVLDALPISFSGMGTRDVSLILFFSLIGVSAEAAISTSIMVLFLGYVLVGFLGFLYWLSNPTGTRNLMNSLRKQDQ
jgi:glycosyltransferase 2 family protein